MIPRIISEQIIKDLKPAHVTFLSGTRRTGKTVLMENIKDRLKNKKILLLNKKIMMWLHFFLQEGKMF